MKKFEEDKELKALIKRMKPDSPGSDFSDKVMNQIFEIESLLERVKRERIFDKGFWIITTLFVALLGALIAVSITGTGGTESELAKFLPDINTGEVSQGYETAFEKFTSLPLSIAGILIASSFLVFIDRFLNKRSQVKP